MTIDWHLMLYFVRGQVEVTKVSYNTLGRPSDEIDPGPPTRSRPGGVEFQQRARVELLAVLFRWKEGVGIYYLYLMRKNWSGSCSKEG
jgi:hypothetical protein